MNRHGNGRTALVLYGTETGTAQDLAQEVGRLTERLHFSTRVSPFDQVPLQALPSYTVAIFVVATTGQGDFPSNAQRFWTGLLKKNLSPILLQDVLFSVVGLGDSSYSKFNWAARKLERRLKQLGACEVVESCEADEQGEEGTDGAFLAWLPLFKAALLEKLPLPTDSEPIPDDDLLPSKWILAETDLLANGDKQSPECISTDGYTVETSRKVGTELSVDRPDYDARPIPNSITLQLQENTRVTPASHWQDVRLLTLITSQSMDYHPGDALSILPKNFPDDVNTLVRLMNWTSMADTPLAFITNGCTKSTTTLNLSQPCPIPQLAPYPSSSSSSSSSSGQAAFTLCALLTSYLDITSIPRRSLFATLSSYTSNPTHKERLLEFTKPQYLDEYYDYATRSRRSILEILQEFDSVKIPWCEAANVFPLLRPRSFSIASGGRLKRLAPDQAGGNGGGTRFELLVAIVKYRTVIKKIRRGVCTRYLAALQPGSTLNVTLRTDGRFFSPKTAQLRPSAHHDVPKQQPNPYLLIGVGTGIAPLRALVTEADDHQQVSSTPGGGPPAPFTLVFGSRSRSQDFFFEHEWAARNPTSPTNPSSSPTIATPDNQSPHFAKQGAVGEFKLITAFSRDQRHKVYVQDRLREHAGHVAEMIVDRGAVVVVCGSSGAMPRAVRQALVDGLVRERNMETREEGEGDDDDRGKHEHEWTQESAERYLDTMEKERRYLQETW